MAVGNIDSGQYKQISATANIKAGSGILKGVFVSSTTAGTITIYNSATTTTADPIIATFTPAAGGWFAMPFGYDLGLYIVIGGTLQATVCFV